MKNTITSLRSYSKKITKKFEKLLLSRKITMAIRELEYWIGTPLLKRELTNLNDYCSNLMQQIEKNYQRPQKKSNFVCVYSSANAYNLSHNEISANIEKCQKISEARWNDNLIEYICNH